MNLHTARRLLAIALGSWSVAGSAAPLMDVLNVGLISGADVRSYIQPGVGQGTPIEGTPEEVLADKSYTALVGQLGNAGDWHESYVELPGLLGKQASSAVVDATGHMEVGVDGFNAGVGRALSRFALTIKNTGSDPLLLQFEFHIPAGEVLTYDSNHFAADDPRAAEAQVFARIDGVLKTPAGPHGGHYDVTEHRLFDFYVGVIGGGWQQTYDASANAMQLLSSYVELPHSSVVGFTIGAYDGLLSLPAIAPYGELTLYYDMLARVRGGFENGGSAKLGDPFDLLGGGGIALRPLTPNVVPEPSSAALLALGGLLLALLRRYRVQEGRDHGTAPRNSFIRQGALRRCLAPLLVGAVALPAFAARPANLAGTTWTVQINRGSEQLVITHQGGSGTAGGAGCVALRGTIGPAPLRGWYCAANGHLHLKHDNMTTGATVRTIDAWVSDEVTGQPLYVGGTVWIEDPVFGALGAYNFSGVR